MDNYKPFTVALHTDTITPIVYIPDIISMGMDLKPEKKAELVAHDNVPRHVAMYNSKPVLTFESFAIATLMDNLGVSGVPITSASNPGCVAYWRKYDSTGTPYGTSVNRTFTLKSGVIVPKTLTVAHNDDAKLTVDAHPIKTSGNNSVVIADNVALPTVAVASARWTIGNITVAGVALSGAVNVEIDFGNTIETRGKQSEVFDAQVDQRTHEPKITITGIDPSWFGTSGLGITGKAALHASDFIYLRKRSQDDANFVAVATTEHIKFAFGGLGAVGESAQAQAQRISETGLMITLARDSAGNAPLVVTTAIAHPA